MGIMRTIIVCLGLGLVAPHAYSAEFATGNYLLGFRGPLAGVVPPQGLYLENDTYSYSANISGGRAVETGGRIIANVTQQTTLDLLTPIWITPWEFAGGKIGVSVTVPFGRPNVTAGALLSAPNLGIAVGGGVEEANTSLGEIFPQIFIGWEKDNFHWSFYVGGFTPTGYIPGAISNVSLNRPGIDTTLAVTYLDEKLGYELSIIPGFTYNWINPVTNYRSGNEFHLEWSATKFITKDLSIGLVGYHYQQLTPDSGSGNRIGPFQGRVTALGGTVGYNFVLGTTPISARTKIYRELDTTNRFQGTAAFITFSLPLWMPQTAEAAPVKAKY
ncbi:SphA family protein [Beijerinckia indica]|uniref:Transporter n=1 Tax=Beijerinckia indica subsp. indica (strain ATCC 9039 / DSM 1715 / NCIMB 8712) TaxID=395963 RepID=B2IHX2_BEII9|nr:transporter [Beijerinckia indica]ACB96015.1 conserved hypothetical protein [Beijerinckia indica subsp. indica ATCC 9039]